MAKTTTNKVRRFDGKMVTPPKDLKTILVETNGVVWSRSKTKYRVRYGLNVRDYSHPQVAAEEFGQCVGYSLQRDGAFD